MRANLRAYFMLLGGVVVMPTIPPDDPCADFARLAPVGSPLHVPDTISAIAPTGQLLHVCREVI